MMITTTENTTTAKLPYKRQAIYDDQIASMNTEPEPVPDGMLQYTIFEEIFSILSARFGTADRSSPVFASSNTFICYDPDDLNVRVSPDFYIAFGVDAEAVRARRMYLPWEVGKSPDFVLEVASESTADSDMFAKRDIYRRVGASEYWRFDPTGGDIYTYAIAGDRLVDGVYVPVDIIEEPDGVLRGWSDALGLYLCWSDGMLKFYDAEEREYLNSHQEEQRKHREEQLRHREEQRKHRIAREEKDIAEYRLRMSEQRNAELEAELRRLRADGSNGA